jgi:hypothetical protein
MSKYNIVHSFFIERYFATCFGLNGHRQVYRCCGQGSAPRFNAVFFRPVVFASGRLHVVALTKLTRGKCNRTKQNRVTASSSILVRSTCTPHVGQLGRNMYRNSVQ